ncbi:MAG: hypothetical protein HY319_05640 [Armatimonadetes bacterium]|nr:hypothetical protein [Armatimonadota bacterium]
MLENVDQVMNRMRQIEARMESNPVDSAAFQQMMSGAMDRNPVSRNRSDAASLKANQLSSLQMLSMMRQPLGAQGIYGVPTDATDKLTPQAQNTPDSCGQTSVAMCVNALTGKKLIDHDIDSRYGFELLNALNGESREAGYRWDDGGEITPGSWELIDRKVNVEKIPVIVALNGPEFSPSGRGHIVTIIKTEGDTVHFADPATGQVRTTTKHAMNMAPSHPDGNFIFYATREQPALPLFPGV